MTERSGTKHKRADTNSAARSPTRKAASSGVTAANVARLEAELAAARQQIAALEQRHADITNRIDWVIDSLHNLTE